MVSCRSESEGRMTRSPNQENPTPIGRICQVGGRFCLPPPKETSFASLWHLPYSSFPPVPWRLCNFPLRESRKGKTTMPCTPDQSTHSLSPFLSLGQRGRNGLLRRYPFWAAPHTSYPVNWTPSSGAPDTESRRHNARKSTMKSRRPNSN